MFRTVLISLCAVTVAGLAHSGTCDQTAFRGESYRAAQTGYKAILSGQDGLAELRSELADHRAAERTCMGQTSLDYIIAQIDVAEAELQDAINALATVQTLAPDERELEIAYDRLIGRFYIAGELQVAAELAGQGMDVLPEESGMAFSHATLLAANGQYDEALALIRPRVAGSLSEVPAGRIPSGWQAYLAIAEAAGDAAETEAAYAMLSDHLGQDARAYLASERVHETVPSLLDRAYVWSSQPVSLPTPHYPERMARHRISGACEVRFDIAPTGEPVGLKVSCDHEGFAEEAERVVRAAQFAPRYVEGEAVKTLNVMYPLEFTMMDRSTPWNATSPRLKTPVEKKNPVGRPAPMGGE